MESNFEYLKTLYENECQRIVKCKDIRNNQVYIYNTIINSNLIKLIDTNILSKIKSNILKVSKSADRIYIVSTPFDSDNQTMLKDYIMNNNLTLKRQFNLAEQLVRLFIEIYSTSDLLQYRIINYDNISIDKDENIVCNGYLKFKDEFDLSDNFTYKNIGNMIHFIFSKEEIDDYDISENIPPDVLKIIVKCLTRDYFHPKDLLNELTNCPIYGMINYDSNSPLTFSNSSVTKKNVIENETITFKTNNSIGMNSIDPSKKYEDEIANDEEDEKVSKYDYNENSKNDDTLSNIVLEKSSCDEISHVESSSNEVENERFTSSNKSNDISNYSEDEYTENVNDNNTNNTINNSESLTNSIVSDNIIDDNTVFDSESLTNNNVVSNTDNIINNDDNRDNKELIKENVIDIYFNEKDSYEDKLLNVKKRPKYLKSIVVAVAILLAVGLSFYLCKSYLFSNGKEAVKENDGKETVHTGDNPEDSNNNLENDNGASEDDKENKDNDSSLVDNNIGYSEEVSNYISDEIITKFSYSGLVAKEVKSDYYEGKTSLLIENKDEEPKTVLFAIIDFSNKNYSYLLNKQFQISSAFKSKKDTSIKLITELYSGDKLLERKTDSFDVSNDLWTVKTTNRKVLKVDRIHLYAQIEGSNSLWIDSVKAEIIK